jgi:hypothetical protein
MRARGSVAHAVASKVGSSMSWHMAVTKSSPSGSTSISAPQWSSQNSPWPSSITRYRKSMNCGGAPMSICIALKIVSTSPRPNPSSCWIRRV